jgi:LysR family transcriptional regulator (chromosome initiation inhibitor)
MYLPSSDGKFRAVLAGWGVGVIPELLTRESLKEGSLVDLTPGEDFRVQLYWHCWNIESDVLESLTNALVISATKALV